VTATLAPFARVGRGDAARWLQRYGVYVAVLVLVVFNLVFTPNFLSASNPRTGHHPGECDERSGDGVGTELDAIAAVVIGGTLLTGGAGTVLGTAVGVLLRNVISNIINQVGGLDSNIQSVISGAFLQVVVVLQQVLSGRGVLLRRRR
jgi:ribose transport system permease protein